MRSASRQTDARATNCAEKDGEEKSLWTCTRGTGHTSKRTVWWRGCDDVVGVPCKLRIFWFWWERVFREAKEKVFELIWFMQLRTYTAHCCLSGNASNYSCVKENPCYYQNQTPGWHIPLPIIRDEKIIPRENLCESLRHVNELEAFPHPFFPQILFRWNGFNDERN